MDARVLAQGVIFLVIVSQAAGSEARSLLVGDSEGWRAGTNYTEWATQSSPFHINDTLGRYQHEYISNQLTNSLINKPTIYYVVLNL